MKRLAIYFFYDKDGIVDDYIPYFLSKIKPYFSEICVVVNGNLTPDGKDTFAKYAEKILVRENTGLDVYAYKYAIEQYGFDKLATFDELICMNFTFFGPFFSLDKLFSDMEKRDCDWWGLYKWPTERPIIYHHIPSFFVAYRKNLLSSDKFREYWETLKPVNSYSESVENHEQRQTPYFDRNGFVSDTWIKDHYRFMDHWNEHWPLTCSDKVIVEDKFPFLKRRILFIENNEMPFAKTAKESINAIRDFSDYDLKLIYDNIKRTQNLELDDKQISGKYRILSKFHPIKRHRDRYKLKLRNIAVKSELIDLFNKL